MSTHNICLYGEKKRNVTVLVEKKKCLIWSYILTNVSIGNIDSMQMYEPT